jgi:Fe-S-cluster containining protein
LDIYKDLRKYFDECDNCGECCKIPGVLLPEQIDVLANHFNLDRKELFERYLIAELCAPNEAVPPAFVLSPIKVGPNGDRFPGKIFDNNYVNIRDFYCVFRDNEAGICSIHDIRPFGCALLICSKMTKAKPIELNKTFYFHKWIQTQDIVFSIYPELKVIYEELVKTVSLLPTLEEEKAKILGARNKIINEDIATIFNGHPVAGMPIYS